MERHERIQKISPLLYKIFLPLFGIGMMLILARFILGLGPTTNMNDGYPWGIWITFDYVIGSAIGTGGFALAILIYLFNKFDYHPLIRSALVTSLFGYSLAGISIIFDLGRWWNFYSLLIPEYWNITSIMLILAFHMMIYPVIVFLEFSPAFVDKAKEIEARNEEIKGIFSRILMSLYKAVNNHKKGWTRFLIVIAALGILLPFIHQSLVGELMVIALPKLHALWASKFLPYLFLISVILIGYSIVIIESYISSYLLNRPFETKIIKKLMPVIGNIGIAWLVIRIYDLVESGRMQSLLNSGGYSLLFVLEIATILIGIYMMKSKEYNRFPTTKSIFIGALSFLAFGMLYRVNVYLFAYNAGKGFSYFPSLIEIFVTLSIISAEVLLYLVFVKTLPVLPALAFKKKM